MTDVFKATAEFNKEVIGLPVPIVPMPLQGSRLEWTEFALTEEIKELMDAKTIAEQADALGDLIYFAAGRLYEMGVKGGPVFDAIHAANMKKKRGELSKRPGSLGYDAIKPKGWTHPDIGKAIAQRPKILVIGHGRHGKDTVCEMLRDQYGFKFTSSSFFCAEHILLPYFNSHPSLPNYTNADACYENRHGMTNGHQHRDVWYHRIRRFNIPDASALGRALLMENDIYCGLRSAEELVACVKANLFDHIIWVDRSSHVAPESESSCTVTSRMADTFIDNNGTLADLEEKVRHLVEDTLCK